MNAAEAAAAVAVAHEEFERRTDRFGELQDLKDAVKAEIATLVAERDYWTKQADAAWRWLQIADTKLVDARDRLRAELRRQGEPELLPDHEPESVVAVKSGGTTNG